jgi:1-deoxy-D-xylulose-5-phosphate synthase
MVKTAIDYNDGPIALRYPRGNGLGVPMDDQLHSIPIGTWEVLRDGQDAVILTFGTTISLAKEAADLLVKQGIQAETVNARFIKPLDETMLHKIVERKIPIFTVEESILQGGFGSSILEFLDDHDYTNVSINRMGIPDRFIEHGNVDDLLEEIHLTSEELVIRITDSVTEKRKAGTHVL